VGAALRGSGPGARKEGECPPSGLLLGSSIEYACHPASYWAAAENMPAIRPPIGQQQRICLHAMPVRCTHAMHVSFLYDCLQVV
jgi:hypothetical protein